MTYTLEAVLEDWSAAGCPQSLPTDCLAWLEDQHRENLSLLSAFSVDVAGHHLSAFVDLPPGAFVCEVVAELLDRVVPMPSATERRILKLSDALVSSGFSDEARAEAITGC